jgi:hypothetical protein
MSTLTSKTWFVSLENLLQDNGAPLRPAHSEILDTDQCIAPYSPLTISLESFCIFKQLDRKINGNDLLVRSWTTYGQEPPVEIVHFFEKNMDLGIPKDNLAVEHMFTSKSYGNQSIELDVQILEVDGHSSIAQDIKAVAHLLGAVFPAILPFTSLASTLYSNLKHVFANPHDVAFSRSFKLYDEALGKQSKHLVPLRCGAYILFDQDVEGDRYKLQELKLEPIDDRVSSVSHDYIVIKIIPQIVNSLNSEVLLANQTLATSLLKNQGSTFELPPSIQAKYEAFASSFSLLKSTARHAQLVDYLLEYKKLKRLRSLREANALIDAIPPRETLNQDERLMYLTQHIRDVFLEDH